MSGKQQCERCWFWPEDYDRLAAENERLRNALEPFAEFARVANWPQEDEICAVYSGQGIARLRFSDCIAAKVALEVKS